MARLLVATMLLCLSTVDSFVARGHGTPLPVRRDSAASSQLATRKTRHGDAQMFGPGGGSFLNLGTPEMIVIGAAAWALLGPKELYRLAQEAGKFLGEWQSLGLQAKNTFTEALESELRADEEAQRKEEAAAAPVSDFSQVPTMEELEQQRRLDELRRQVRYKVASHATPHAPYATAHAPYATAHAPLCRTPRARFRCGDGVRFPCGDE